jgi:hypothetical protein
MAKKVTTETNILTKSDIGKSAMILALTKTLGVVTPACKKVGISRETHYEWFNSDSEYQKAVLDIKNISIDFVESVMFQQIRNGDTGLVKYFLNTQGKSRGYVEKADVEVNVNVDTVVKVGYDDDDNG